MTTGATRSFARFRTDVFRLHREGAYDKALALVDREAASFPEEASGVTYWRVCLLARRGDVDAALRVLGRAIETGWWRAERIVRRDPDLAQLQGMAEFEHLVGICRAREQVAQTEAKPTLITLVPENPPPAAGYPLLIALYGFGGNVADFGVSWKEAATRGWLVALPQASQVVDWEGYAWDDWDLAAREMRDHFVSLRADYRIDTTRVVLAGFSQGGVVATWLALRGSPVEARGVLAVVPAPREPVGVGRDQRGERRRLRMYILVGARDFAAERVRGFARVLESAGLAIKVEERADLDHEIPEDFDEVVVRALSFITGHSPGP